MQLNCNYCYRAITEKTKCCLPERESFYAMLVFLFYTKVIYKKITLRDNFE